MLRMAGVSGEGGGAPRAVDSPVQRARSNAAAEFCGSSRAGASSCVSGPIGPASSVAGAGAGDAGSAGAIPGAVRAIGRAISSLSMARAV
jgi:hypothetical protein